MHAHTWRVSAYLQLGVPRRGFVERFTQWTCTACPVFVTITGDIRQGTPLHTPEHWQRYYDAEQHQQTPEAKAATLAGLIPHLARAAEVFQTWWKVHGEAGP